MARVDPAGPSRPDVSKSVGVEVQSAKAGLLHPKGETAGPEAPEDQVERRSPEPIRDAPIGGTRPSNGRVDSDPQSHGTKADAVPSEAFGIQLTLEVTEVRFDPRPIGRSFDAEPRALRDDAIRPARVRDAPSQGVPLPDHIEGHRGRLRSLAARLAETEPRFEGANELKSELLREARSAVCVRDAHHECEP